MAKKMFIHWRMDRMLVVACSVLVQCYHLVHGSDYTSCNNEQATNCKNAALGGSLTSLTQGGQCEAKSYVAFTHTCTITAHYQPDMDYCCCAVHQRVMCCRYYQSGNLFRCVETEDTVTTLASVGLPLPLELLLPVILVPITLIACCVICCIRCCLRHKEDGDVFCRCTGEDDDCALTKQVQLPVYMPCSGGGGGLGAEEHSLLSGLPPPAPHRTACSHSASFGHVHDRSQWSTGSLRYSMPAAPLDSTRGGPCHQAQACAGCHCLAVTTPCRDMVAAASCPRHRPATGGCCHGGGSVTAYCRQRSIGDVGGGGACVASSADWANCVCACAGQVFNCQSSVSSGASDQCSGGHLLGGGGQQQQHAVDSSACVKMPLLSPNSSCGGAVGLVVLPSAPPALTSDESGDPALGPPLALIYATSPPSYDESVAMDAALATPTKPSLG